MLEALSLLSFIAICWLVAKLVILLTPALFYSTMATGGGFSAAAFGSSGTMDGLAILLTAVQLVFACWMLWRSAVAWRQVGITLRLI